MHDLQDLINQFENAVNELKVVVFDDANPYFYIAHVDILCEASIDTGPSGIELLPDFMQGKVYRAFRSLVLFPLQLGGPILCEVVDFSPRPKCHVYSSSFFILLYR